METFFKTILGSATALIILSLLFFAFIVLLYKHFYLNKPPLLVCGNCGWEGKEQQLDSFSTAEQEDHWFQFCPECGSQKIIFDPKYKTNATHQSIS